MTAIVVSSDKRPRLYVRKFDYSDARRRYAAGERVVDLAAEYGVSTASVYNALTPQKHEARLAATRRWRTTTCEHCGGAAMKLVGGKGAHNKDGRILCNGCRAITKRERVRFDEMGQVAAIRCVMLDCANGQRWQQPENFGRGHELRDLREGGFHGQCRACNTKARQAYRNRNKVPCQDCGTLVEGKGRASHASRGEDPARPFLCGSCWHKRRWAA